MSIKQCCSLCCTSCDDYKLLQNESGKSNKFYEITVKYFDPMLLTDEGNSNLRHIQVLCQVCWYHINEFHEFQQTVLKTRMLWEHKEQIETLPIEIKPEDCENVDTNTHYNKSFDVSNDEDVRLDYFENQHLKTDSMKSLEDTTESIYNQLSQKDDNNKDENELPYKTRRVTKPRNANHKSKKLYESDIEDDGSRKRKKFKLSEGIKEKGCSAFNLKNVSDSDAFIAEWKPELVCDICSETANSLDKLRSHFKEKHKTRFYVKCCERKFYRRCILVNHIQLHLNPETHKCDICGKCSTTKDNLKQHMKIMHENTKQLKCDICEKLFKHKSTLERHLLTHATGSKDFICSKCGKGYVDEELLKFHVKRVHNNDRVCDQCGKTIHGFQALKRHLMDHARYKFPCDVCGLELTTTRDLKRHQASIHNHVTTSIERPKFPCDVCGLELSSTSNLKHHQASYHNDGTTIYVCGVCGKVTASENGLSKHKRLVHVERKHKCTYCEKAFKSSKSLREHIATHTGKYLYQCPHCPRTFQFSANMYHHRKKFHPVEWEEARKNRLQLPKINDNQVKKLVVI